MKRKRKTNREMNEHIKAKRGCTLHVWRNSKKRQVKFFGAHLWLVWGGEKQHVVYLDQRKAACDCNNQERAYNQTCSHIQAVKNKLQSILDSMSS